MAKPRDRPYRSGRSPDWIKIKNPDAPAATRIIECRLPGERASLVHPFGRHGQEAT